MSGCTHRALSLRPHRSNAERHDDAGKFDESPGQGELEGIWLLEALPEDVPDTDLEGLPVCEEEPVPVEELDDVPVMELEALPV